MKQTIAIRATNDEQGYTSRTISLDDDGSLVIEGQDLGSGVGDFWGGGFSEYEFARTIRREGVARLKELSGVGDANVLESLRDRFGSTRAMETFLEENGIESSFWSRVGD
ncbi:MAG: hypothetical protein ABWZ98_06165 [Nakamurella sp.]